jgi:hypothetical protein
MLAGDFTVRRGNLPAGCGGVNQFLLALIARKACLGRTMFVHTVIFYLRADLSEAQKQEFRNEGLESLRPIQSVHHLYVGAPAAIPPRPVVDLSFSFAITALFADVAGHNAYQTDPLHLAFLTRFKGYWTRVQIYDAE